MASSSATLSLCSSLSSQCKITPTPSPPSFLSLYRPSISFGSGKHGFASAFGSTRPALFSLVPKLAEAEAVPVVEAETEAEAPEKTLTQVVDVANERPKREEIFAVVMIGSRQYIVFPGRKLHTQRLKGANVNDKIVLNKVLLVGTKSSTYIGKPVVTNAAVHAVVEEQGLDKKVVVFKYKPKKKYRRNIGHRQPNTRIRITGITGYEDYPAASNVILN